MKFKKLILPLIIAAVFLFIGIICNKYYCRNFYVNVSDSYVNASDLTIYRVYVQVVDSETNQPIDVIYIEEPKPLIEKKMRTGILAGSPIIMESLGRGTYKVTWLDLKESEETVTIVATGYPKIRLPLRYREQFDHFESSSGTDPGPAKFKLTKSNKPQIATPRKLPD